MSETVKLRLSVQRFAEIMEQKLRENDHKKRSWLYDTPQALGERLLEEVSELLEALATGKTAAEVRREAADVANFAMMISEVAVLEEVERMGAVIPPGYPEGESGSWLKDIDAWDAKAELKHKQVMDALAATLKVPDPERMSAGVVQGSPSGGRTVATYFIYEEECEDGPDCPGCVWCSGDVSRP